MSRTPVPTVDTPADVASIVDELTGRTAAAPADYLMQIDPRLIEETPDQIREDATPDDALIQSVQRSGILQPPVVVYDEVVGNYRVVMGHRRVNAAKLAGLDEITVIVRDVADAAAELVDQINENEHRKGLSNAEISRGWADLESMFGWTPEQIGEAVAEPVEKVTAGIRAQRSEKTRSIVAEHPAIDLEKAAILAEFDDNPKVQKELTETALTKPQNFDWKLEQARDSIALKAKRAELNEEIEASGVPLAKVDQWGYPKDAKVLRHLFNDKGKQLTAANHKKCPGHAAYVSGWSLSNSEITYCCTDWEAQGHTTGSTRVLTDEEKAEQAEREARAAALSANRAARRQWIHDLLPGKINQLPGVYAYMAAALASGSQYNDDHRAPQLTLPLLDIEPVNHPYQQSEQLDEVLEHGRIAPFRLMLAISLGYHEQQCERGRDPHAIIRHLLQLQAWGYDLTDVDQDALAAIEKALADAAAEASAGGGHDDDFADAGDTLRDQAHEHDEDGESE